MKITATQQVYIQPIAFKSITFHHQGDYFLQFQLIYNQNSKKFKSAYPSLKNANQISMFNKKQLSIDQSRCSSITQSRFKIMYNEQSVLFKNGVSFQFQTQIAKVSQIDKNQDSGCSLQINLVYIQKQQKKQGKQASQKNVVVGNQKLMINLNIKNDFSSYSSNRYVLFTKEEYFCSLLLYIQFINLGYRIKPQDMPTISQLYFMKSKQKNQCIQQLKTKKYKTYQLKDYQGLLQIKQLSKLYKFLINQRLKEYKIISTIYRDSNSFKMIDNTLLSSTFGEYANQHVQIPLDLDYLLLQQQLNDSYLMERYQTTNKSQLYQLIYKDALLINLNLKYIWEQVIILKLKTIPDQFVNNALKYKIDRMRYVSDFYQVKDDSIFLNQKIHAQRVNTHKQQRRKVCKNSKFYNLGELKHSMLTFHNQKGQQIVSNSISKQPSEILVVLVHGYKGSERDMVKIKSYINTLTQVNFLVLKNLQDHINQAIETLGKVAADQIIEYLKVKTYIKSINFIGFSLGGIIAKAALIHLQEHKFKFNLFLTFASPHLGLSQIQNCLVNAGLFWMKHVNDIKNMKQLCIQAAQKKQPQNKGLVDLSDHQSISWFKMIVLVGCKEDAYVPQYSALVSYNGSNNLIKKVQSRFNSKGQSIDRISVWFDYKQGFLDKLTGRKGHVSFLEDDTFLQYIFIKYLRFF